MNAFVQNPYFFTFVTDSLEIYASLGHELQ